MPRDEILEALKNAPLVQPSGQAGSVRMRDALGENHPVFRWLAENLYRHDPDMLTMLLDDFERVAAGYHMQTVLPAIRCPVLLLQADPAAGGIMGDAEVRQALPLLAQGTHVQLTGLSHVFHNERKEPVVQTIEEFLAPLA